MAIRPLPALALLLAACADHGIDYPALMPTDQLLAEPAIPGHADIAATSPDQVASDLAAAGAALAVSQAEVTAAEVGNDAELAARAEALRRRAEAMSAETTPCADPEATEC
ncbi:MAG: hypothetical protein DI616_11650 [Paracoccus denitrificans]|uniref:Lipoprotein n=1 Tax=Paracoccus denitrificans TaxID=266 RepID=A0A533I3B5_PARDE|nr:MAG: hypothetical protein DI616_11650 [Paracoccus denitrificans]